MKLAISSKERGLTQPLKVNLHCRLCPESDCHNPYFAGGDQVQAEEGEASGKSSPSCSRSVSNFVWSSSASAAAVASAEVSRKEHLSFMVMKAKSERGCI